MWLTIVNNKVYISQTIGAPHLKHFSDKTTRHQIDKGGRMSGKSSKNEVKIPYLLAQDPTAEVVVVRKVYKDHRDTTFAGLKIGFERLGWKLREREHYPRGTSSKLYIRTQLGNYIHFVGLNDYESQKGARPTKIGNAHKILWLFEITQFANEAELNNTISNYMRGKKDWFIILYEYNPHPKKSHWTYEWVKKMEARDDAYVNHTNYKDLAKWQQDQWLGKIALDEIQNLKKTDYEQYKSIYLGLPANLTGTVYKQFRYERHVKKPTLQYADVWVGVDYGEADATVFTATGMLEGFKGIEVFETYYHKNGVSNGVMNINDYAQELMRFCSIVYSKTKIPITVYVDPANLTFIRLVEELSYQNEYSFVIISNITKRSSNPNKSSIQERVDLTELMFGADFITISPDAEMLIKAYEDAEYDKNGERADDGRSDIDSLDSFEYSWLKEKKLIRELILGVTNGAA